MITTLTGRVVQTTPLSVVIAPSEPGVATTGFEFEVFVPAYWIETLAGEIGRTIRLHTKLLLESQNQGAAFAPRLIGFPSEADRAFFDLFTSVKGLGQRKALKAMAMEPAVIAGAIAARDAKGLQRLPEIGKRLAETVIAELHGKLGSLPVVGEMEAGFAEPKIPTGPAADAVAALMALGQTRGDAEQAVARVVASLGDGETLEADDLVGRAFALR